jgi:hypothetical protein
VGCGSAGSWAGWIFFPHLFSIFSPGRLGWVIGAAGVCVGGMSLCVCRRVCPCVQLCGRAWRRGFKTERPLLAH